MVQGKGVQRHLSIWKCLIPLSHWRVWQRITGRKATILKIGKCCSVSRSNAMLLLTSLGHSDPQFFILTCFSVALPNVLIMLGWSSSECVPIHKRGNRWAPQSRKSGPSLPENRPTSLITLFPIFSLPFFLEYLYGDSASSIHVFFSLPFPISVPFCSTFKEVFFNLIFYSSIEIFHFCKVFNF